MKRIFALSFFSLFFAAAGCGAGPDVSSTPETSALAQKLTHEARTSAESPGGASDVSAPVASSDGISSNVTVIVRCNKKCIELCGDAGDDVCAASCCEVIVREN
jgi:hypothetical protein